VIELHRIDDTKILINSDLIECVEEIPDTIITLITGNKYIVREKFKEILEKIIEFRKKASVVSVQQYKSINGERSDLSKTVETLDGKNGE
jgi:flagellar protein FlbD